jgi:ferredoxin
MNKRVIFCNCSGERINPQRLQFIEKNLRRYCVEIIKLSDLCGLSALNKDRLIDVFPEGQEYLIIGCYSRSLKLLLGQVNADINNATFKYLNFIELTNDEIFREVSSFCNNSIQIPSIKEINSVSDWPSWFPIIDYSRCTGCGQCADFCLFGVYEKNETRVNIIDPHGCKNNCPACARICPRTAIIFPKYKLGGAIGGSDTIDEIAEQERQALDIQNILEGDIFGALEQRKIKRQSIIRNEAMKKALEERADALNKTKTL